ncbi:MAG: DUF4434 domain-containing protein [Armatimonadota bacterium]
MSNIGKITGTFLDEITWDIGSQNWSAEDWKRDFEAMSFIGIDTVVIIRGGLRDQAVFPSEVVGNTGDPDLAKLFLDEAEKHNMRLFFGTYDSGEIWSGFYDGTGVTDSRVEAEIAADIRFVDEVMSRYGGHPAFHGWYMTHEVGYNQEGISSLFKGLATHMRQITPSLPILISPFYATRSILSDNCLSPDEFRESWRELLGAVNGLVDIMAFQDGVCTNAEFPEYLAAVKSCADEFGIEFWNNVETFDRNLSYKFPPRDIRVLSKRLELAQPYVAKHITFEFSHFMSPNSCFPGAANLYRRYCETILGKKSPF